MCINQPYPDRRPPTYGGHWPPSKRRHNGYGIASLTTGVIAVFTCIAIVGALFGVAALILGVVGLSRARRDNSMATGSAITGIALGSVAIVVGLGLLALVGLDHLFHPFDECTGIAGPRHTGCY